MATAAAIGRPGPSGPHDSGTSPMRALHQCRSRSSTTHATAPPVSWLITATRSSNAGSDRASNAPSADGADPAELPVVPRVADQQSSPWATPRAKGRHLPRVRVRTDTGASGPQGARRGGRPPHPALSGVVVCDELDRLGMAQRSTAPWRDPTEVPARDLVRVRMIEALAAHRAMPTERLRLGRDRPPRPRRRTATADRARGCCRRRHRARTTPGLARSVRSMGCSCHGTLLDADGPRRRPDRSAGMVRHRSPHARAIHGDAAVVSRPRRGARRG